MKLWLLRVMILLISHIRVGQAQAKTKPVLTVHPNVSQVIRGQTVTLSCTISGGSGSYHWYQDGVSVHVSAENDYTIIVDQSHKYSCYISEDGWSPTTSNEVALSVIERPKAVVTLQPDGEMFTGEKITLTCEIRGDSDNELIYNWYKDGVQLFTSVEKNEYSFTPAESFSSKYTCSGKRKGDSQSSDASTAVTLTVSEKPKPELTSNRKGDVLTGNVVTLTCKLKSQSAGWRFSWIKPTQKTETETETHFYTINSVKVSDGGQYRCRAGRGNPVYYTDYSDALWVKVTAESPPVSLIINPSRTQHFTTDSLSLSCEDQSNSTGWTVRGYTHSEALFTCSSVSGATCNIGSLSTSHTGGYWCQSESGGRSNSINITVHNGNVILDSPVRPVTEGHPLTLRCLYRFRTVSDSGIDFYKDGSVCQNNTKGEMTITNVSKSDEGFYHCKYPKKGESPKSLVSVRDSGFLSGRTNADTLMSALRLISSLVTVSVYVLLTIVLAVKCYRARVQTDEDNTQNAVI